MTAPIAARKPVERLFHGDRFVDDYEWLRDKSDPEVIAYLEAENAYAEASTAGEAALREQIFTEIVSRTKETDLTVPIRHAGYWHYTRTVAGQQYRLYCRVPATGDTPPELPEEAEALPGEQVLLDGNLLAADSEFFSVGTFEVSPAGDLLAYSVDLAGDERFTLRVRDLATGQDLPDEVTDTYYDTAWSADGRYLFYIKVDDSWRPYQVWRHAVGTGAESDVLVFAEPDERFWLGVELSRNQRVVQIGIESKLTREVWLIDAAEPESQPVVVAARREGIEYHVEHAGDRLLILHNTNHPNFELSSADPQDPAPERWQTVLAGSDDRRLLEIDAFAGH
ncbi:MAG TPA: hypothetical protein VFU36_11450, partial [Jatrophihabitans sp.]|nr:hypothetical protein [Jatrophihabitans sp.]